MFISIIIQREYPLFRKEISLKIIFASHVLSYRFLASVHLGPVTVFVSSVHAYTHVFRIQTTHGQKFCGAQQRNLFSSRSHIYNHCSPRTYIVRAMALWMEAGICGREKRQKEKENKIRRWTQWSLCATTYILYSQSTYRCALRSVICVGNGGWKC